MLASVYPPQLLDLLVGCAAAVAFILFFLLDAREALKRRALWFPGRSLILSALTIQLSGYFDYQSVSLKPGNVDSSYDCSITEDDALDAVLKIQLISDSGRVVICVFIAYLLPGLVSSGFGEVWSDIVALALSVLAHVLSEYYLFFYVEYYQSEARWIWFRLFSYFISASLLLLVLLSIFTVFAGKSIRKIIDQKVPLVLSCCPNSRDRRCRNLKEHVFKCWIVARSCQPDYIMARSVFSSLAGLVVTICVVSLIVKLTFLYHDDYNKTNILKKTTFSLQFIFVLLGWIAVLVRWLTAVIFFPREVQCSIEDFWTRNFIEVGEGLEFWTRSIIELRNGLVHGESRYFRTENSFMTYLIITLRLKYIFLLIALFLKTVIVLLSKSLVFLSKGSWFFAQVLVCRFVYQNRPAPGFEPYRDALSTIRMKGERAESLWIANQLAFQRIETHWNEGRSTNTGTLQQFINIHAEHEATEKSLGGGSDFKYVAKWSWKMRAVSLIHFMLCCYDNNNVQIVNQAIDACSEAWDLMDFVDSSDPEADLVCRAADKEFYRLQNIWKQHLHLQPVESQAVQEIRQKLEQQSESQTEIPTVNDTHDSKNWMTVAVNKSLLKTGEAIETPTTVDNIRSLLENVIFNCLENELKEAILTECTKWGEIGKEDEIYDAAFIAGKAEELFVQVGQGAQGNHAEEGNNVPVPNNNAAEGRNVHVPNNNAGEGNTVPVSNNNAGEGRNVHVPNVIDDDVVVDVDPRNDEGNDA